MRKMGYNKSVRNSGYNFAELCKGSTRVSESLCLGSIPSSAAIKKQPPIRVAVFFIVVVRESNLRKAAWLFLTTVSSAAKRATPRPGW